MEASINGREWAQHEPEFRRELTGFEKALSTFLRALPGPYSPVATAILVKLSNIRGEEIDIAHFIHLRTNLEDILKAAREVAEDEPRIGAPSKASTRNLFQI